VSRFEQSRLVFGHGTTNAQDEAAFLILETLHLPIDSLDDWVDARLTMSERRAVLDIVERRISTRKPASYLTGTAYIQGRRFAVDEGVIVPRSYIGELICNGRLAQLVPQRVQTRRILDLCTGSAALAILAALEFPEAALDATEASREALEVARRNVADYGLTQRIALHHGDLFDPVGASYYDLIIANPPYVPEERVAAFPPEYAAEPALAHLGGADGLDLVRRIIGRAPAHLAPDGMLILEVGSARAALETAYPRMPFLWLDTEGSEGEVLALAAGDLAATETSLHARERRRARKGSN